MFRLRLRPVIAFAVLALALPLLASAQIEERTWVREYDVDSATLTFCSSGTLITGTGQLKTSGSSTTVTSAVAGSASLSPIVVGDQLSVVSSTGAETFRTVTAKASNDSITVSSAVDWTTPVNFRFRKVTCGTDDESGWLPVGDFSQSLSIVQYEAGDLTGGLSVQWQCRGAAPGSKPMKIHPPTGSTDPTVCGGGTLSTDFCVFATATVGTITNRFGVANPWPWSQCRVGFKATTADPSDAGANLESVTIYLIGAHPPR